MGLVVVSGTATTGVASAVEGAEAPMESSRATESTTTATTALPEVSTSTTTPASTTSSSSTSTPPGAPAGGDPAPDEIEDREPAPSTSTTSPVFTPAGEDDDVLRPDYAGAPWFQPGSEYAANFPDPQVVRHGDTYWAYATSTGGPALPVLWSTDLERWYARDAYSPNSYNSDPFFNDAMPAPPRWSIGGAVHAPGKAQWAPGVAEIGGRWAAYTSWEIAPGRRCISAALADDPRGPFVDEADEPLQCDSDPAGSIDAQPFVDGDGTPYLLWKSEGGPRLPTRLWSRELSPDGLSFAPGSSPRRLLQTQQDWEQPLVESPAMVRSGGAYWLVYSANHWASRHYAMGVARCDGPLGPCERTRSTPLVANDAEQQGSGGGSLFVDADGRLRLAYHAWNPPFSSYPDYPECLGSGTCTSQGQRYLRIEGVAAWAGTLTVDPVGAVDVVEAGGGEVRVAGWMLDPSDPDASEVHVYVNGRGVAALAHRHRGDIAAAFPGLGAEHGFELRLPADRGTNRVCAYGIDRGAGSNRLLGCRTVTVEGGSPIGYLDTTSGRPGSIQVAGWALDPDTPIPIDVHLYVGGTGHVLRADSGRGDVASAFPGYGSRHGFSASLPAPPGRHTVCAYGINTEAGQNRLLGCGEAVVPGGSPFGVIDQVRVEGGSVRVAGWVIDPDVRGSVDVHAYVDQVGVPVTADRPRADVRAAFPAYSGAHGFTADVTVPPGARQVCVYGIDVGLGDNRLLGCRALG